MPMRRSLRELVLGIVFAGIAGTACAQAGHRECSLGSTNSIFTPSSWPARTLEEVAHGQLGVVDPRFDHFYLFIAYRRIAGKPLAAADLERLRPFDPCWIDGSRQEGGTDWSSSTVMGAARAEWLAARSLPGLPPEAPQAPAKPGTTSVMGYAESQVPNCNGARSKALR